MNQRFTIALVAIALLALSWSSGCSTAAPPPPPAPEPVAYQPPEPPPPPAEWNIFPNIATGNIDIYHNGVYYGSITANSPGNPPVPRKIPNHEGSL